MILLFSTFDEHAIHIHLYIPPNLLAKHLVYQSLVRGPHVLQTKRHNPVAIESLTSDKGRSSLDPPLSSVFGCVRRKHP